MTFTCDECRNEFTDQPCGETNSGRMVCVECTAQIQRERNTYNSWINRTAKEATDEREQVGQRQP